MVTVHCAPKPPSAQTLVPLSTTPQQAIVPVVASSLWKLLPAGQVWQTAELIKATKTKLKKLTNRNVWFLKKTYMIGDIPPKVRFRERIWTENEACKTDWLSPKWGGINFQERATEISNFFKQLLFLNNSLKIFFLFYYYNFCCIFYFLIFLIRFDFFLFFFVLFFHVFFFFYSFPLSFNISWIFVLFFSLLLFFLTFLLLTCFSFRSSFYNII